MSQQEIIQRCLNILDDINDATRVAIDTLNDNAFTIRMVLNETLYGAQENHDFEKLLNAMEESTPAPVMEENQEDTLEALTDRIVAQIQTPDEGYGIRSVSIEINEDKFNVMEVMQIVQEKLCGTYKTPENKKEETDDDFNFKNPIDE